MSTLFRLVTGHAFAGEYAMRFLWNNLPSPLPEEAIACHWGMQPHAPTDRRAHPPRMPDL
jgi:hypothetical protein